jgi:Tfp pilus assembly protein PilO
MAFSESGWMRRFHLSKRSLAVAACTLAVLLVGSSVLGVAFVRAQYHWAKLAYLERENRSLTERLQGQAEQLGRLKAEMARLKDFEERLRAISGLESKSEPILGTGQGDPKGSAAARERR